MEGFLCNTCSLTNCPAAPPPCNSALLTLPILDYGHSTRLLDHRRLCLPRPQVPLLYGKYLYGDFAPAAVVGSAGQRHAGRRPSSAHPPTNLYTFGQDVNGELYLGRGNGTLAKIRP